MFNLYGNDRLTEWKEFRNSLEVSEDPLSAVAELWSRAPFVNHYLDPQNPKQWPDPWHLIIDGKFDELAIALGMLYTIKLTERFIATPYEIHMTLPEKKENSNFFLVVDNRYVLNYEPRFVVPVDVIFEKTNKIWAGETLP